jgi:hypothetical protein
VGAAFADAQGLREVLCQALSAAVGAPRRRARVEQLRRARNDGAHGLAVVPEKGHRRDGHEIVRARRRRRARVHDRHPALARPRAVAALAHLAVLVVHVAALGRAVRVSVAVVAAAAAVVVAAAAAVTPRALELSELTHARGAK